MEAQHAGFARDRIDEVRDNSLRRLAAVGSLLDRRRAEGKVRRCHGDLHLRNICLLDGKPTLRQDGSGDDRDARGGILICGRVLQSNQNSMSYMQDVEQSLRSMLTAFAAGDLSI